MPNTARIKITRVLNEDELGKQIFPKMEALGQAIGARAQRVVPKRTWALHDTVDASTEQRGATVTTTVGAGGDGVEYAMDVERGNSRMGAQAYLRPAFNQTTGSDLRYKGKGIQKHGTVAFTSRRSRARSRKKRS